MLKLWFKGRPLNSGVYHVISVCAAPGEVWQLQREREKKRGREGKRGGEKLRANC